MEKAGFLSTKGKHTLLGILLFASIVLLNFSTKLYSCSFFVVLSIVCTNMLAEFYDEKYAKRIIKTSIVVSMMFLWKWKSINLVVICSLFSIVLSLYASIGVVAKLKELYKFEIRNIVSLFLFSLIDSLIVSIGLVNKFPLEKILAIGEKDFIFKLSYSAIASGILFLIFRCYKVIGNVCKVRSKAATAVISLFTNQI